MRCKYCGFGNGEDDHRCLRCGRRLAGLVITAPSGYVGAAVRAVDDQPSLQDETRENPREFTIQQQLFQTQPGSKVIPFEQVQRQAAARPSLPEPAFPAPAPATKHAPLRDAPSAAPKRNETPRRTAVSANEAQGTLEFIMAPAAKPRTLKTSVEAQVYCDQPVATPIHRFVAGAIDATFILLGFGLFVMISQAAGGSFGQGTLFWISLAAGFAMVSLFYGLVWAIAGRETAGMRMTDLQLITFDGFALDGPARALRFAATCLSFCSGGIGLIWALADEESLTWQDHISKTFPAIREVSRNFVRR